MEFEWHDIVGGFGAVVLLTTYLLLQINFISAKSLLYSVLNAVGSGGILVSLLYDFNMSAFVIEASWLVISIIGAAVTIRETSKTRKELQEFL